METLGIDLLSLVGTKLKKVGSTNGGEYHGACPFCGGTDRFIVQPHARNGARWFCRQCSPKGGDSIAFVQKRDGVDFKTAIAALGLSSTAQPAARKQVLRSPRIRHDATEVPAPAPLKPDYVSLNDSEYQRRADDFIAESVEQLKPKYGSEALDYLRGRGLSDATIGAAEIGYNPMDRNEQWGEADVWLPAGIVIPWQIDEQIWRVNFRRMGNIEKGQRYISAKGAANGLYNADDIRLGCTVVMVEGEFDALAIRTGAAALLPRGLVAVATGSSSGAHILRWVARLSLAERVLLAFDVDENGAGDKAAAWWRAQLGNKAVRLTPTAHDVNDMLKSGHNLVEWITSAAPELTSKPVQKSVRAEIRENPAPPYVESQLPVETPQTAVFSGPSIDYHAMNKKGRSINPFSADYDHTKLIYQVTP